jgi:hypothetical protein
MRLDGDPDWLGPKNDFDVDGIGDLDARELSERALS